MLPPEIVDEEGGGGKSGQQRSNSRPGMPQQEQGETTAQWLQRLGCDQIEAGEPLIGVMGLVSGLVADTRLDERTRCALHYVHRQLIDHSEGKHGTVFDVAVRGNAPTVAAAERLAVMATVAHACTGARMKPADADRLVASEANAAGIGTAEGKQFDRTAIKNMRERYVREASDTAKTIGAAITDAMKDRGFDRPRHRKDCRPYVRKAMALLADETTAFLQNSSTVRHRSNPG